MHGTWQLNLFQWNRLNLKHTIIVQAPFGMWDSLTKEVMISLDETSKKLWKLCRGKIYFKDVNEHLSLCLWFFLKRTCLETFWQTPQQIGQKMWMHVNMAISGNNTDFFHTLWRNSEEQSISFVEAIIFDLINLFFIRSPGQLIVRYVAKKKGIDRYTSVTLNVLP